MSTFNPPADIAQITLAKSSDVNAVKAATAVAFALLPNETKLQRGTVNFSVDTGTANNYVVTLDASITSYTDGLQVVFRPLNSNTGTASINLNGLGAKSIRLTNSDAISAGDISAGAVIDVRYSTATGFFHLTPNSAIYAHDAGVSADAAAASASAASSSASSAATSASNASTSATTATTQAGIATTQATNASTSATTATTQATNASTSATNAATSATTATTQAGIATTQATNAATSATSAAASYDSFDDRYLGSKTSDPTLDNDGNALLVGALYWNSATSVFKVWSGSAWITNLTSNQFGTNVATFLQTPSSANLAAALTDETGTGANVFASNPTFPAQINLTASSGYNIYASGSAPNYLAGRLGIGVAPANAVGVYITQTTTESSAYGILNSQTASAATTASLRGFQSSINTAASAFTLGSLSHYYATQGSFGAGSSVSYQIGFDVNSNLTGATNNYGFYGGIAAGTGRYNLYMAGSAPNYLAGSLSIGAAAIAGPFHAVDSGSGRDIGGELNSANAFGFRHTFYKSRGTNSAKAIVSDSDETGLLNFYGYDGAAYINSAAIRAYVDGTPGTNDMPGRLEFATTADGASNPLERMRIESSGNVGISGADARAMLNIGASTRTSSDVAYNRIGGTIPSTATAYKIGFWDETTTPAGAVTYPLVTSFKAQPATTGANSTITSMVGLEVNPPALGSGSTVTNNYGFYSTIASGTGRYNLYMAGTADNYLAGKLMVGSTQGVGTIYSFASGASNGTIDSRTGLHIQNNNSTTGVANARIQFSYATNTPKAYIEAGVYGNDYLAFGSSAGATENMRIDSSGNVGIGASSFGTNAAKVIGIANGTAPTTSPAGMGQLYVEGGALKYRGSSGTVTTIAAA